MEITLMEQAGRWDCGVACLAMILDKSLAEVESKVLRRKVGDLSDPETGEPIGVTTFEMAYGLWERGVRSCVICVPPDDGDANWHERIGEHLYACRAERIENHLLRGGVAILGVPSLRHDEGEHWIVADGVNLYDPAPKDGGPTYTNLLEHDGNPLRVFEAVLINKETLPFR